MPTTTTIEETVPTALAEQETHPAESPGTCQGLARWQSYPLAKADDKDLLALRARELALRYDIPLETATAVCCTAVSAACGNAFRLTGPGQIATPPSLLSVLASASPTALRFAAADAFATLVALTRGSVAVRRIAPDASSRAEEERLKAKIREARRLREEAQADRAKWVGMQGEDFERQCSDYLAKYPQPYKTLGDKAAKLMAEVAADHWRMQFQEKPMSLVEGATVARLMDCRELSADGTVFNFDPDNAMWPSLSAGAPSKARDQALRLAAGWGGSTRILGDEIIPASSMGALSVTDPAGFAKLWKCKAVGESGLGRMIFVGGSDGTPGSISDTGGDAGEATSRFNRLLLALSRCRTAGGNAEVRVGKAAEKVFMDFVADVGRAESDPNFVGVEAVKGAAGYALRFALLLHLGAGKPESEEVGEGTMKRAIALVVWGVRCAAKAVDDITGMGAGWGDDIESEVFAMVLRVRKKGRLRKRDLFRSYHDQRREMLDPVLDRAIANGLIVEEDGGTLTLPRE